MKHNAIVGNIGHFDNEIDMAGLNRMSDVRSVEHQAAGGRVRVPRRPLGHRAGRGSPAEPRLRHRAPELRDVDELHQPGAGPDRAVTPRPTTTPLGVYMLPKHARREVARLHLDALGVRLTHAHRRPGRLHRHPRRRALQARPLPLLQFLVAACGGGARASRCVAFGSREGSASATGEAGSPPRRGGTGDGPPSRSLPSAVPSRPSWRGGSGA